PGAAALLVDQHSGRSTIETIDEVRLKQFCARFNTWVEQASQPARSLRRAAGPTPRQRLSSFPPAGERVMNNFSLLAASRLTHVKVGGSGARLPDAGRRQGLCRRDQRRPRAG